MIKCACKEGKNVARQAYAGLLWSKQFYHYVIKDWLDGDPDQPAPPEARKHGRNSEWRHLFNRDIVSMPDKWEYPWVNIPGGVLGPKTDGGVPLAAENWTQKDRGKNEIWGLKDRIL